MKSTKALISIITALILSSQAYSLGRGFAVIIDKDSYKSCQNEVDNYKKMLNSEGFQAIIYIINQESPQQIREILLNYYKTKGLEGAVFIGQIPVPMVRDAQYMTSAFKMDQKKFSMRESSVPSDRFYDDFDLKFDYLGRDSSDSKFYNYTLRNDSPQKIECDIYTGRIKPTKKGSEGYEQIKKYLIKTVNERTKNNPLDVITTYTGEGSFSNSLTAWKEEGVLLREQFPGSFGQQQKVKLLFYRMYPYMKEIVTDELRREEMDLMIFHEHGMPERQYLSEHPASVGADEYYESAKRLIREKLKKAKDDSEKSALIKSYMTAYNIDSTWFNGVNNPKIVEQDSINEANTGIVLKDVATIKPNARIVIFDACYNGDFREESYIGAEYIFADGKTIATFGNSVNVLQDKSSSDLMGMLGMGYSVGEWAKMTNILESHITGDPTFHFSSNTPAAINLNSTDIKYWLNLYDKDARPDAKGIALWKLFELKYSKMPEFLANVYSTSPYNSVRLQVYHLLQFYNTPLLAQILKKATDDPYEFIRRKSLFTMGRIGSEEFISYIVRAFINDNLDERVFFNSVMSFDLIDSNKLKAEFEKQLSNFGYEKGRESLRAKFDKALASRMGIAKMGDDVIDKGKSLKSRLMAVTMLRNNPYHNRVEEYLKVLSDNGEDLELRLKLAEALGWFTLSYNRGLIVSRCSELAKSPSTAPELKSELLKTAERIKVYMR